MKAQDTTIDVGRLDGRLVDQCKVVLEALSEGRATPDAAATLMQIISVQARIIETDDLAARVAALEAQPPTR